ncbi:hypothetical protein AVEN_48819-1 [Araneus ventricosus]|uniref:Uncharacterized protein n=1 Tax=Araneus ventricosus TaxID=182803 RepID=A0A4Y2TDV2_ARAVE|nr:hypothetical protein AVEN_48819-1 [Araneus ventricosus]
MIVNKRDNIRELSFRSFIKARNLPSKRKTTRSFEQPKIYFLATDYIEMIRWNTTTISPQPSLRGFTHQDIWYKVQSGGAAAEWNCDRFPGDTQSLERCVKLVTEA